LHDLLAEAQKPQENGPELVITSAGCDAGESAVDQMPELTVVNPGAGLHSASNP
jgi:hypothetical protein